jgi:uncharacterized cupredoxin-like copper-binding protein
MSGFRCQKGSWAAVAALVLVMSGCGDTNRTAAVPSSSPIAVRIRDFQFEPRHLTVRRGQSLEVLNDGAIAHNLTIERGSDPRKLGETLVGTGSFLPGRRVRLRVDLPAGHTYTIACTIPGHRDLGLYGTLRVR